MKKLVTIVTVLLFYHSGKCQWTNISSSRGNFSFSFPQAASPYDTLGLLTYITTPIGDSTITFQVNFMDSVYMSGNDEILPIDRSGSINPNKGDDPCYVDVLPTYANMYQITTEGTIEGFVTSDYSPCHIRGKELTIRHEELSGLGGYYFAFTRYFYWDQKFLAFTVTGPQKKLSEIYSYKNKLFSSISIYK